ncbi:MAG TPA: hypothetical protein PKC18_09510 [Lacipirellulaceae bacterium]|nr:hypothetical protein [Lacipirellulaceae bacterium]
MHPNLQHWTLLASLVALLGCGDSGKYVPVSGTVSYVDGSAIELEMGSVTFTPVDGAGRAATGTLNPDGTFRLTTEQPNDGAAPGEYKVTIQAVSDYREQTAVVAAQYGDPATTPLTATVDSSHRKFDFKVEK